MPEEGPRYAGTGANFNDGGTTAWSNPTNIQGDTTSTAATCAPPSNGATSQRLRASNFSFDIPAGATINGVVAEFETQASNANRFSDTSVRLLVAGSEGGNEHSTSGAWGTGKGFIAYGAVDDLWDLSLTPAIVNASGFGVSLKGVRNHNNPVTASVFRARITVYYTLAGSTEEGDFTANAVLRSTQTLDFAADAVIEAAGGDTITADFTADAITLREQADSATIDAIALREQTDAATADAVIFRTWQGDFAADAVILGEAAPGEGDFTADAEIGRVGPVHWISPADGFPIDTNPVLEFRLPDVAGPVIFLQLQLDHTPDFDGLSLRTYTSYEDNTDWEYWDGDDWVEIPITGVPAAYSGNPARLTITNPLSSGTWYRRIRGGTR